MNKSLIFTLIGVVGLAGGSCHAQSSSRTLDQATVPGKYSTRHIDLLKSGRHLDTVTCRDYNFLDEIYRPQAVTYAANYGPKGHAHPTVTLSGVEKMVPIVGATCRDRPGDHFVSAVDRALRKSKGMAQN